ncbi:hypothetical protein CkaCkLH20_04195 [Colletotrichum karsti]|uniref:Chromo domain-containing protein n=1 Tax=Colletotrichum karsti TaxID=1095194 RepID=A0A9P6I765_9PEZI|nr:uncharacterized protein CkaCkLH20_04195 [Colletotrichum karsti]KAF9878157.1 hypothetical protein CkaCkLH20_04195 [Colletotrichum karsti]
MFASKVCRNNFSFGPDARLVTATRLDCDIGNITVESSSAGQEQRRRLQNYQHEDIITGHEFKRATKQVLLLTQRPADASKRLVPERIVQRKAPSKLYDYWNSFGQPREVTLGTEYFHIFDLMNHDFARGLQVQWEGYGTSDEDTTWEPAKKVRSLNPVLLCHYLEREGIGRRIVRMSMATGLSVSPPCSLYEAGGT